MKQTVAQNQLRSEKENQLRSEFSVQKRKAHSFVKAAERTPREFSVSWSRYTETTTTSIHASFRPLLRCYFQYYSF